MIKNVWGSLIRLLKKIPFIGKHWEIWVYVFFGGLTTVFNFLVYTLLAKTIFIPAGMEEKFAQTVANALAWLLSVVFAFWVNRSFVFGDRSRGGQFWLKFGEFFGMRTLSGTFEILSFPVLDLFMNDYVAKILISLIVIILNYVFSKLFIFASKKSGKQTRAAKEENVKK